MVKSAIKKAKTLHTHTEFKYSQCFKYIQPLHIYIYIYIYIYTIYILLKMCV